MHLESSLRTCVTNKFAGDADAAGMGIPFGEPQLRGVLGLLSERRGRDLGFALDSEGLWSSHWKSDTPGDRVVFVLSILGLPGALSSACREPLPLTIISW